KHKFKVPSLRLVTLTPPYFHDGSTEKLEDAIRIMGRYQLALKISDADIASIIAFLRTLTGKHAKLTQAE
ncbi:MAG: cytochrome B6, partial [Mariprofundus sp.]